MSKNHTLTTVSDTLTDSGTSDYPQPSKPHILPCQQHPPTVVVQLVDPGWDHPPAEPKGKQVVLDEFVSMWVAHVHMHIGIFDEEP